MIAAVLMAAAMAQAPGAKAVIAQPPPIPMKGEEIQVPARTPLYCEDGSHAIQPFIYGDFGDLVAAYDRLHHMSARVVGNGKRASGEDYGVLLFSASAQDTRSPHEQVGYVITAYRDGYAIRSAYDKPKDEDPMKLAGTEMCAFVLGMFVDSDPARAAAFREQWRAAHPDSTSR